ncbi:MAG: hypothetical protein ISS01_00555 [Nanoarchaeota archaeon]|nr:hypothetical protein [Nanoarchaeota archaeon]
MTYDISKDSLFERTRFENFLHFADLGREFEEYSYSLFLFDEEFEQRQSFGYKSENPDAVPEILNVHPYVLSMDGSPRPILEKRMEWALKLVEEYGIEDLIVSGISSPQGEGSDYDFVKETGATQGIIMENWFRGHGFRGNIHRVDEGYNTFQTLKKVYGELLPQLDFDHVEEVSSFEHLARIHLQGIQLNEMFRKNFKRSFSGPRIRDVAEAYEFMMWELTSVHETLGFTAQAISIARL